jgi:hypothetical protein
MLPVTSQVEPGPIRLLRPVDPLFVDTFKSHMKKNPSRDVKPIVGLIGPYSCQMEMSSRKTTRKSISTK